jgi:death on curing protein
VKWLHPDTALAIHDEQLAEHGGGSGARDQGGLDAALARARHLDSYGEPAPDVYALAAAYAVGIIRGHPFVDGNKRTGWVCCETFLMLNGVELGMRDAEIVLQVRALAAGEIGEADFAGWLREAGQRPRAVKAPRPRTIEGP